MTKKRLLLVEWVDSCSTNGWRLVSGTDLSPARCVSVGWTLKDDKECIALTQSMSNVGSANEHASEIISIPRSAIVKKRVLK